jgi:hypothetical protein
VDLAQEIEKIGKLSQSTAYRRIDQARDMGKIKCQKGTDVYFAC